MLWPDYGPEHLRAAIEEFQARERRYGGAEVDDVLADRLRRFDWAQPRRFDWRDLALRSSRRRPGAGGAGDRLVRRRGCFLMLIAVAVALLSHRMGGDERAEARRGRVAVTMTAAVLASSSSPTSASSGRRWR